MAHICVCDLGIVHVNDKVQETQMKNDKEADFKTILNHLQSVYCGKIAYEFMHLPVSSLLLFFFFFTRISPYVTHTSM